MKQLLSLAAATAIVALAACTTPYGDPYDPYGYPPQGPTGYPDPYPAPYPTPYPGQQPGLQEPYKATGTEPFWSLTIDDRDMRFEEPNGYRISEPTPPVQPGYNGDQFHGRRIDVTITHQRCSDGMSDRTYPDRVDVRVDGRSFRGCGGPMSIYQPGWEQGYPPGSDNYRTDYGMSGTLQRTNWQIVAINDRPVPARDFYINFFPDNRLQAKFGCNTINAGYQQAGERVTVGAQQMTRMACPDMTVETAGSNILSSPMTYQLAGDRMTLRNSRGTITARRID